MLPALKRHQVSIGFFLAAVILFGFTAGSYHLTTTEAQSLDQERQASLEETVERASRVAGAHLNENESSIKRLRLEVRSEVRWSADHLARDGVLYIDPEASSLDAESDARRLHGLLRRTLDDWPGATAVELLVASEQGIWTHRVERRDAAEIQDESETSRTPQTLWYAPSVQRAIAASGRRSMSGEIRWVKDEPVARLSIALQNPGEVVQGVLVASLDATTWTQTIASLGTQEISLDLLTHAGRSLRAGAPDSTPAAEEDTTAMPQPGELIQTAGDYEIRQPVLRAAKNNDALWVVGRASIPAQGWLAWWQSPFKFGLAGMLLLSVVFEWMRRAMDAKRVVQYEAIQAADDAQETDRAESAQSDTPAQHEPFPVREWLGDVRSCLERDAAKQDREISVRCEQTISTEIVSDAVQLGGLLVALGREALSITPEEAIALEVREDAQSGLRFEIDAGGDAILPAPAMRQLATSLGARFVPCEAGRVALTVPVN